MRDLLVWAINLPGVQARLGFRRRIDVRAVGCFVATASLQSSLDHVFRLLPSDNCVTRV